MNLKNKPIKILGQTHTFHKNSKTRLYVDLLKLTLRKTDIYPLKNKKLFEINLEIVNFYKVKIVQPLD